MRIAVVLFMLLFAATWSVSSVAARPGAGPGFLEPEASSDARSRPGKPRHPPKPNIGRAGAKERPDSWSYRPGFAAPWSEPSAKGGTPPRPGSTAAAAAGAGQGSFTAFYFWILVGGALLVVVSWGLSVAKHREEEAWTSGKVTGGSPARAKDAEQPTSSD